MNQPALNMTADVEREIASLEQRMDALKHQVSESRGRNARKTRPSEAEVGALLAARRMREAMIGKELFADPAWDILLELYGASLAQRRMSTSDLTSASAVPATTALRWIHKLESVGLLSRSEDPLDRRRVWVEISADGEAKMRSCLEAIRFRLTLV